MVDRDARRLCLVMCDRVVAFERHLVLWSPAAAAPSWGPRRTVDRWACERRLVVRAARERRPDRAPGHGLLPGRVRDRPRAVNGRVRADRSDRGASWSPPVRVSQGGEASRSCGVGRIGWHGLRGMGHPAELRPLRPARAAHPVLPREPRRRLGENGRADQEEGPASTPRRSPASGKRVFISWVDAETGQVRVARSGDGGKTFKRSVIGRISVGRARRRRPRGSATIGAAGNAVGVAWIASGSGAIKAACLTNGGKKWHSSVSIVGAPGSGERGNPVAARMGDKLALAWTTPSGVFAKIWSSRGAPPARSPRSARAPRTGRGSTWRWSPSPGGQLGAVWSACRASGCDPLSIGPGSTSCGATRATERPGPPPRSSRAPRTPTNRSTSPRRPSGWTGEPRSWATPSRSPGWTSYGMFLRVGPESRGTGEPETFRRRRSLKAWQRAPC